MRLEIIHTHGNQSTLMAPQVELPQSWSGYYHLHVLVADTLDGCLFVPIICSARHADYCDDQNF